MIQVEDLLPKVELEPSRDILGDSSSDRNGDLVVEGRVNTDVVYVSQVLDGKEPAAIRCPSLVKEDMGVLF
jgi:hypothetical protein